MIGGAGPRKFTYFDKLENPSCKCLKHYVNNCSCLANFSFNAVDLFDLIFVILLLVCNTTTVKSTTEMSQPNQASALCPYLFTVNDYKIVWVYIKTKLYSTVFFK